MNTVANFFASHKFSDSTKATYTLALTKLIQHPYQSWDASNLLSFVMEWGGNSTQYVNLCACRKFIAWSCGQTHPSLFARIKRIRPKKQRSLNIEKILILLASFDTHTTIGARDQAIAALAIDSGLRASELAHIQLTDVDLEHRTLQVIVKGGQWGSAIFSADTAMMLDRWLSYRIPADGVNNLFVNVRQSKDAGRALTRDGLKTIFKNWSSKIGWKISPHDCRRTLGNVSTLLGSPQAVTMAAGRWQSESAFRRYTQDITAQAITPYLPISNALKQQNELLR
jgi:integrase